MNQEDIEFLEQNGWIVECESPLEIREEESGSFATGYAAKCVLESLRNEERENQKEFKLNTRVRELMEEAFDTAEYPPDQTFRMEPNQYFCGKFAELLIKECIQIPYDMWDKAELNADVAVKIDHRIKDHFGVE